MTDIVVNANDNNESVVVPAISSSSTSSSSSIDVVDNNIAIVTPDETPVITTESSSSSSANSNYFKRMQVAVTGGTVTAVGLVLIPAPLPLGAIVTAYGMSILATEFDEAQVMLDNCKHKLEDGLEKLGETLRVAEEEGMGEFKEEENKVEDMREKEEVDFKEEMEQPKIETETEEEKEVTNNNDETPIVGDAPVIIDNLSVSQIDDERMDSVQEENGETKIDKESQLKTATETEGEPVRPNIATRKIAEENENAAGKAWKFHSENVRKATSKFILNSLLPAIRNTNFKRKNENIDETTQQDSTTDGVTETATATATATTNLTTEDSSIAPESTSSMGSLSSTDCSSASSEEDSLDDSNNNMESDGELPLVAVKEKEQANKEEEKINQEELSETAL